MGPILGVAIMWAVTVLLWIFIRLFRRINEPLLVTLRDGVVISTGFFLLLGAMGLGMGLLLGAIHL